MQLTALDPETYSPITFFSIRLYYLERIECHPCKHLGIDPSTDPDDRYSIGTRIYS